MPKSLRKRIVSVTVVFAVVEWLLFELVRMPYRPPADMLTFLGQEKFAVFWLMGALFVGWLIFLTVSWFEGSFKSRDYFAFIGLLAVLATVLSAAVCFPMWDVTPWDLILR